MFLFFSLPIETGVASRDSQNQSIGPVVLSGLATTFLTSTETLPQLPASIYCTVSLRVDVASQSGGPNACLAPLPAALSFIGAAQHLRVEAARLMIEQSRHSIDVIAAETGFADRERMRRAFLRAFGQPPQVIRRNARVEATD